MEFSDNQYEFDNLNSDSSDSHTHKQKFSNSLNSIPNQLENSNALKADQLPLIIFPDFNKKFHTKSLEFGSVNHFILQKDNQYAPGNTNSNYSQSASVNQDTNSLFWEAQNSTIQDFTFFHSAGKLRYQRPPIRPFELDPMPHEKQIRFFEPTLDIPPSVLGPLLSDSLNETYLSYNFDPFIGNRACLFTPECLNNSQEFSEMKWIAYTGGKAHNEFKFIFARTHDQISLLETAFLAPTDPSTDTSIPLKYGVIGNPYIASIRNRFIIHCSPSPYNSTEVLLTSSDHSVRIWDFNNRSEKVINKGSNIIKSVLDWSVTEYWNSPRTFLHANRDSAYLLDSRASETSNKIIFCNYSSSSKSDSSEKIVSVKTDALNPFHSIIGTTKNISVYDMRFNSSPLLSWKHDFSSMDPPVFLDTILHSDIKSSVDNNKNICSIVAASKHKALISTFTYHQSRSNGSPVISLSRSSLNSFHSHESNKIQLLDNISQSQFYSSDLKTKIQRSEMYPFPNLDGIVIDKCFSFDDFDDDSNFYKTDGGMYGNNSTIYQFGQDGSLYSQNYKSFKISSNINSKKYKKSENSQNSAMTLLSNYLSDPNTIKPVSSFSQLESSQVTRDLGLNLIDSN
ncbi:hypothetical protein AYI70_g8226, partial [Smittium culicis]